MRVAVLALLCACAAERPAERPPPRQSLLPPPPPAPPPPPKLPEDDLTGGRAPAHQRAVTECAPFEQRPTPAEEETFFAPYLATELLRSGGGAYVDRNDARDALVDGPKTGLTQYVQRVGLQVASKSKRAEASWMFAVLDERQPIASSSMGGHVFVTTGLLKTLTDEAELATALAHEIAHVVNGDAEKSYALARKRVCIDVLTDLYADNPGAEGVAGAVSEAKIAAAATTLMKLGAGKIDCHNSNVDGRFVQFMMRRIIRELPHLYTLEQETAADLLAAELLTSAGYEVKLPAVVPKLVRPVPSAREDAAEQAAQQHSGGKAPPLQLTLPGTSSPPR